MFMIGEVMFMIGDGKSDPVKLLLELIVGNKRTVSALIFS